MKSADFQQCYYRWGQQWQKLALSMILSKTWTAIEPQIIFVIFPCLNASY